MKRLIFISVIAAYSFSTNLLAQENIIKVGIYLGNLGIQYERSIGNHLSLVGQIGYSDIPTRVEENDSNSDGVGYYIGGRYYFSENNLKGFHLGPYCSFLNLKDKDNTKLRTDVLSVGITGGYQWIFNNHLTLGTNLGIGSLNIESDVKLDIGGINFFPNLGVTLGYNF